MQDCSISSASAMEIMQSCTKPWNCLYAGTELQRLVWQSMYLLIFISRDFLWMHSFLSLNDTPTRKMLETCLGSYVCDTERMSCLTKLVQARPNMPLNLQLYIKSLVSNYKLQGYDLWTPVPRCLRKMTSTWTRQRAIFHQNEYTLKWFTVYLYDYIFK